MALWIRTALPRRSLARQVKFLLGLFGLLALIGCQPELVPLPQPLPASPTAPVETVRVVTMVASSPEAANPTEVIAAPTGTPEPDPELANILAMPAIHVQVVSDGGAGFVNLRSGPGPIYAVVGQAPNGATLAAIAVSEHGEWLLVHHPTDPNRMAWLYRLYTNFDPSTQKLPVMKNLPGAATRTP